MNQGLKSGGNDTMSPNGKQLQGTHIPRDLPAKKLAKGRGKAAIVAVLTLMSISTTGCSVMHNGFTAMTNNNSWNDTVVVLRNRSYSAKAWHRRKQNFCNERHNQDFCNGFRAGYEAVCNGLDGCTPAFPPSEYWSWEYQSGEGQARTSAWFIGYPHGVRAAEEEGNANWRHLQMSPGMQSQYQNAGVMSQPGVAYSNLGTMPAGGMSGTPMPAPQTQPDIMASPALDLPGSTVPSRSVVPNIQ